MRIGLVGCGLIGCRRAKIVHQSRNDKLIAAADTDEAKVKSLSQELGCRATIHWEEVVADKDIEAVIISTPNKFLAPITLAALQNGKHVLCEKPMGRNYEEAMQMEEAARSSGKILKIGFNHRYHPAVKKAYELSIKGEIGSLFLIRCVYGHGGRPGYEKEWRGNFDISGGGELLDQGVHLIDLCQWFMGDFTEVMGLTSTFFWNLEVEDNAFAILRTSSGQTASLHSSWTQWKNSFLFEIFGREGYLKIEGLGKSYGAERLILGKRRPESGPPNESVFNFPEVDISWEEEWGDFRNSIQTGNMPLSSAEESVKVMKIIDSIYRSAILKKMVKVSE
jgi:predicted dehydrogenase